MEKEKIPVYFIPGLGAGTSIFEYIKLDSDQFDVQLIEWEIPKKNESLKEYALQISEKIKHKNPVLIGVSFGGILAQEISQIISVRKTIIISSVKSESEFPRRMKIAKFTKIYKLIPTSIFKNIENYIPLILGNKHLKARKELYKKYLAVRDETYLNWSIKEVVNWESKSEIQNLVHIHGSKDEVFPIKYIKNCIVVNGGTHAMIIYKQKWMNENLPEIIKK